MLFRSENNGFLPESHKAITEQVMAWGFNATNHSKEHGGAGFTLFEQMLASEQFGKVTNAIWNAVRSHDKDSQKRFRKQDV